MAPSSSASQSSALPEIENYLSTKSGNCVASDAEISTLKDVLLRARDELADYDKFPKQTRQLQNRRSKLADAIGRLSVMVNPSIRYLSPELLFHIFRHLASDAYPLDFSQPRTHPAVILSHVCSQWRGITHALPELWSQIFIVFPETDHDDNSRSVSFANLALRFAKCCLDRSKQKPLTINFSCPRCDESDRRYDTVHHPVWAELVKHSDRWRDVTLALQRHDPFKFLEPLPLLEGLTVSVWGDLQEQDLDKFEESPIFTPRLTSLKLVRSEFHCYKRFTLDSLTVFSICDCFVGELCDVVQDCTKLIELELEHVWGVPEVLIPPLSTSSESLKKLTLEDFHSFNNFLRVATLPRLTKMSVSGSIEKPVPLPLPTFRGFISRSKPSITELEIGECVIDDPEAFLDILSMLPSLTELSLSEWNSDDSRRLISDEVLQYLTILPKKHMLPNLLRISVQFGSPFNLDLLTTMICSRCRDVPEGVTKLKKFVLYHDGEVDGLDYAALDALESFEQFGTEILIEMF